MKKGTGGDPFADDDGDEQEDGDGRETETRLPGTTDAIVPDPPHDGRDDPGVPWVYTRSNVKQDRDMVQFYLRAFVQDSEQDFVDAVGDYLGADVSTTDVREAAYVAAMRRPEIVAAELEVWGFEGDG